MLCFRLSPSVNKFISQTSLRNTPSCCLQNQIRIKTTCAKKTSRLLFSFGYRSSLIFSIAGFKVLAQESSKKELLIRTETQTKLKKAVDSRYSIKTLICLLLHQPLKVICSLVFVLLLALQEVYFHLTLREVFSCIGRTQNNDQTLAPVYKFVFIVLSQSFTQFLSNSMITSLMESWSTDIRLKIFDKIIYQDLYFYQGTKSSEIMHSNDIDSFKSATKNSLIQGIRCLTQATGSFLSLFIISPNVSFFVAATMPSLFFIGNIMSSYLRTIRCMQQENSMKAQSSALETLNNIRSIKALAMEEYQIENYKKRLNMASENAKTFGYFSGAFQGLSLLSLRSLILGVSLYAGTLVNSNKLGLSDIPAIAICMKEIQSACFSLSSLFVAVIKGIDSAKRTLKILNIKDGYSNPSHQVNQNPQISLEYLTNRAALDIEFDNLIFTYANRPQHQVLGGISFKVKAGSIVALVGKSGAGKSTLFSLLERFYEPSSGKILIGGLEINRIPTHTLRRSLISYMSQETQIFNNTVMENIRCARPDATDEEVISAAKLAQADEFITQKLPEGYQTILSDGASADACALSGGQKQRIGIARILLKDTPIVMLDESTASLDPHSEVLVQKALETVLKGRTVLIIAHKLSTIQHADKIIVFDNGKIIEIGSREKLLKLKMGHSNMLE